MRKYPFIALLLFAFICMMASPNMPVFKKKKKKAAADSTAVVDSVLRDSVLSGIPEDPGGRGKIFGKGFLKGKKVKR